MTPAGGWFWISRRFRRGCPFLVAACVLSLVACSASSPPATTPAITSVPVMLDPAFGSGGVSLVDVARSIHEDEPFTLIPTAAGGFATPGKAFNAETGDFDVALLVFQPDGMLDPSFSGDGVALVDFGHYEEGQGVVQHEDGKFVVGGFVKRPDKDSDFALVRFNPDGNPDASFGNGGKTTTDFLGHRDEMLALGIQSDGKLVAGGYTSRSGEPDDLDLALARYNSDGSLDSSFGEGGKVTTDVSGGPDFIFRMLVQDDGKIVGVGSSRTPDGDSDFAIARYNIDGTLDRSFNAGPRPGVVATDFYGGTDYAFTLASLPDGKLLVGGLAENPATGGSDIALARYNIDGSIDRSFSGGETPGLVTVDFFGDYDQILALAIQPDGKILGAGHAKHPERDFEFAFVRFTRDGVLDESFGLGGRFTYDGFGGPDGLHGLVLQPDGKATAAGDIENPATSGDDFALIQLLVADPDWTVGFVNGIADEDLSAPPVRAEMLRVLQEADAEIKAGNLRPAIALLSDLRDRMDGCGDAAGSEDWIVACPVQLQVRSLIDQILFKLNRG